ncbi:MAG: serine/threonine protein kinase [Nannocystis sp.]|nr:serine/threonine protein kinase [Nannocystis sp.]
MGALSNDSIIGATLMDGDGAAPEVEGAAPPVRGHAIGRYLLISQLGAGAMGIVYAAYDPELDRKVALKLLKHHGGDVAASRKRLQREAQALGRLNHLNVVSVHDVGVHKDRLFVAMEYVAGQTLGSWMAAAQALPTATGRRPSAEPERVLRARPWREVLDVFMQAGRGLAAAHDAGLVHRDFKPENVMLSADGRVRVMDFGLARGDVGEVTAGGAAGEVTTPGAPVLSGLTQVGAIIGTPAYMSLEQFEARDVDARSDQFSFCVALYEALYGERPFAGDTIAALTEALRTEAIREAPRGTVVPSWVRAVVLRGLAHEPEARFGSMEALLDALAADPAARRRRLLLGAGLALAMVLSAWGS